MKIVVNGKEIILRPLKHGCIVTNKRNGTVLVKLEMMRNVDRLSSYECEKIEDAVCSVLRED